MRSMLRRSTVVAAVLASAAFAVPAQAAWTRLTSGTGQEAGVFQISAFDSQHVMAVGSHDKGDGSQEAVLWTSHDGGASWEMTKPTAGAPSMFEFYTSVEMTSADRAFVGGMGKLYVTSDGGLTWTAYQETGWRPLSGPTIWGVSFPDGVTGWLVGSGGVIRKSSDNGETWVPQECPSGVDPTGLFALDPSHAWAWSGNSVKDEETGEVTGYEGGALLRTADGETWTALFQDEPRAIGKVFFLNPEEGWMTSNSMSGPRLEKTTDGGATWTDVPIPAGGGGAATYIYEIVWFDRCEGLLIAERDEQYPQVFYTSDRGATWTQQDPAVFVVPFPLPIPAVSRLTALAFPSRDVGFAGGTLEAIFAYTADGPSPNCGGTSNPDGGGGGWDDGGGDDGCGCRATGRPAGALGALLGLALLAGAFVVRRRSR